MNIVVKHGLSIKKEKQTIFLPKESRILSVSVLQEQLYVFVAQDVNEHTYNTNHQSVEFAVFKDGRHFDVDGYQFLGTVVLKFGNIIYHVFYRTVN